MAQGTRRVEEGSGRITFCASYSHDGLEANLSGEVALQILLELLQLGRVVDVVEGGVVEDAAGRVLGYACWKQRR